jgi:hypothetical protein
MVLFFIVTRNSLPNQCLQVDKWQASEWINKYEFSMCDDLQRSMLTWLTIWKSRCMQWCGKPRLNGASSTTYKMNLKRYSSRPTGQGVLCRTGIKLIPDTMFSCLRIWIQIVSILLLISAHSNMFEILWKHVEK